MVATPDYLADHLALVFKSPASGESDNAFHHGSAGVKRVNRFGLNIVRDSGVDEESSDSEENETKGIKL